MGKSRHSGSRALALVLMAVTFASALFIPASVASADGLPAATSAAAVAQKAIRDPEPKVTICHRTFDRTNPYNQIVVTIPQANGHAALHEGPIFTADGPRPWGDIIPPIPGLPNGQTGPTVKGS